MKRYLQISILAIVLFAVPVFANSKYVVLLSSVNIRKGPSTGYDIFVTGKTGSTYDLVSDSIVADEKKNGDCDSGWYKIKYNGTEAYICSEFVTVKEKVEEDEVITPPASSTDCEKEMAEAGFPVSYWSGLCALKAKHSNWSFKAIKTGLDWQTAVEKESTCGKSYIATSNADYIDKKCKNAYTKTWYPASQKAVAFYMDPRNFLTENYIFQFEYLKYEKSLSATYISSSNSMLSGAAFYKFHTAKGVNFGSIVNDAGAATDVNPVFLSARMLQELGTGEAEKNLYTGEYTGNNKAYFGYYNFYNIGVSDSCATSKGTTLCGLEYAKTNGWNSLLNAIKGGSSTLSNSYISIGQYTGYLQKFNVVPNNLSKLYIHQYMTNVAAPSSESTSTYNTYKKLGFLNTAFAFYIPVYNNMNNEIQNNSDGATNEPDDNPIPSEPKISISEAITNAGLSYQGNRITGIEPNTSAAAIKAVLENTAGVTVNIMNNKAEDLGSKTIGTGSIIKITTAQKSENYIVVIHGDTSGDGEINALDLLQVQKNILGSYTLNDEYKLAGDTSGDGVVNALDLLQVQQSILGSYKIKQ